MRLVNYALASENDKKQWLESITMTVGLPYFGGKSRIGKYIFNSIFNLAVQMQRDGKKPQVFIDAFTGGGKMGLSVPRGWFDTIVINDLNYGIASYYKCCQNKPRELIMAIEKIGELMNEDFFYMAAYLRSFGKNAEKWELKDGKGNVIKEYVKDDEICDPLIAAAMTYWVTSASFNNMTDPENCKYNLFRKKDKEEKEQDQSETSNKNEENKKKKKEEVDYQKKAEERELIQKLIAKAKRNIPKLHRKLTEQHYIIENLDYRELIKKYNSKAWKTIENSEELQTAIENNAELNKLWYFDPPYHPYTLHVGKDAPYADTFTVELANEMVEILHGNHEKDFGKLEYFIKSDYDPKEALMRAKRECKDNETSPEQRKWYEKLLAMEKAKTGDISNIFEEIEIGEFAKFLVGSFDKGAINHNDEKTVGQEFIWTHGFDDAYIKKYRYVDKVWEENKKSFWN